VALVHPSPTFLTSTVAVQWNVVSQGAAGGRVSNWTTQAGYAAVACSIQPAGGGGPVLQFGDRQLQADTDVYFAEPVPITSETRLVSDAGVVYLVLVTGDEAEQGRVAWCKCVRQW
jgi:hypothetical protein